MSETRMGFDVYAKDNASKTFDKVSHSMERGAAKGAAFGVIAGAGLTAVIGKVQHFAKESINAYREVGGETLRLQRYIGGTAEQASRLRFAAEESGVGIDDLTKGFGKFSKFVVSANDQVSKFSDAQAKAKEDGKKFNGAMGANAAALQKLGIQVRDAKGNLLPMTSILPDVADKFKEMAAGPEKTALAMQLFGKGGMALLPFLNKGAEGIKELEHESDKLGNTLSKKDLDAIKKNTMAKRQWHAAVQGLQIQMGRYLYPALTQFATVMVTTIIPAIVKFSGPVLKALGAILGTQIIPFISRLATIFSNDVMPVLSAFGDWVGAHKTLVMSFAVAIGTVVGILKAWQLGTMAVKKAQEMWTAAQAAFNAVMAMNPIVLVIVAVAALAAGIIYAYKHSEKFRVIVHRAFHAVGEAFSWAWDKIKQGFHWLKTHWPLILAILTGPIGIAVYEIAKHWDKIVGFVKGMPGRIKNASAGMWDGIKDAFRAAINWLIDKWNGLQFKIPSVDTHIPHIGKIGGFTLGTPDIPRLAKGGVVTQPTIALIGEGNSDEAVVPLDGQHKLGGDIIIQVSGALDPTAVAMQIEKLLLKLKRDRGMGLNFG